MAEFGWLSAKYESMVTLAQSPVVGVIQGGKSCGIYQLSEVMLDLWKNCRLAPENEYWFGAELVNMN